MGLINIIHRAIVQERRRRLGAVCQYIALRALSFELSRSIRRAFIFKLDLQLV